MTAGPLTAGSNVRTFSRVPPLASRRPRGSVAQQGPRRPDRASGTPLWSQVCDDLRRRIAAGEFAAGFPGELSLTEQYEVSRHTIREALRVLRAEGVVSSGRGRSSTVAGPHYRQSLGALYSLFETLEGQGVAQRSEVLRLALTSNSTVAAYLGLPATTELVVLERIRHADREPLAHDTSWLPASLAAPLLECDFSRSGLYAELQRFGILVDAGAERIAAIGAPRHIARSLGVAAGAPVFSVERRATAQGRAAEWRETFIRGDRFTLETDWTPAGSSITANAGDAP